MVRRIASSEQRRAQLQANLQIVTDRIDDACARANRSPDEITLIAVTKTFPVEDIRLLHDIGVRHIGENRDQEARTKVTELDDLDVRWHFVGRLQTNKCRSIASYAHAVHAVDREQLVTALAAAADRADRVVDVFVQVSLDNDPQRGGAVAAEVPRLADLVATAGSLRLRGVMAVAPLAVDPAAAFAGLADLASQVRAAHPEAASISAGMSGDVEAAIGAGATHVRIGTALLGGRAPIVR